MAFLKFDYIDDPQCDLGTLRHCNGGPKMMYSLRCETPKISIIKSLYEFDARLRKKLENLPATSSRKILDSSSPTHNPMATIVCQTRPKLVLFAKTSPV